MATLHYSHLSDARSVKYGFVDDERSWIAGGHRQAREREQEEQAGADHGVPQFVGCGGLKSIFFASSGGVSLNVSGATCTLGCQLLMRIVNCGMSLLLIT